MHHIPIAKVSAADQAAFRIEATTIRKTLRTLQRDRWKQSWNEVPPVASYNHRSKRIPISADQIDALQRRLLPVQERLRYWQSILMEDESRIRSPVRLWDTWQKLRDAADHEAVELEYLGDRTLPRT
jgi:hypothetical protein